MGNRSMTKQGWRQDQKQNTWHMSKKKNPIAFEEFMISTSCVWNHSSHKGGSFLG